MEMINVRAQILFLIFDDKNYIKWSMYYGWVQFLMNFIEGRVHRLESHDNNEGQTNPYMIFVLFSPHTHFFGSFFLHTKVRKSQQNGFRDKTV